MPQLPTGDYFMVIGLSQADQAITDVFGTAQVWVAVAANEEEAVAKVAALDPDKTVFTAQVVPTFPPPAPE